MQWGVVIPGMAETAPIKVPDASLRREWEDALNASIVCIKGKSGRLNSLPSIPGKEDYFFFYGLRTLHIFWVKCTPGVQDAEERFRNGSSHGINNTA